jgi:hypothetical protein
MSTKTPSTLPPGRIQIFARSHHASNGGSKPVGGNCVNRDTRRLGNIIHRTNDHALRRGMLPSCASPREGEGLFVSHESRFQENVENENLKWQRIAEAIQRLPHQKLFSATIFSTGVER